MRLVVTGAAGFLGWHLRCRLHARTRYDVLAVDRRNWSCLPELLEGADAVIHVAGVNRGSGTELVAGNVRLASDVADALTRATGAPRIVYANSVQIGNRSPYAEGKEAARDILRDAASASGGGLVDVVLPNLFGEHGRPEYNSFVATFADAVVRGHEPAVADREIDLLHAQGAADALIRGLDSPQGTVCPQGTHTTVASVWATLRRFQDTYALTGDLPEVQNELERDLFNTYRTRLFPEGYPILLHPRSDERGRLVEAVRNHGSGGQSFVSTTVPGATRGRHYHLRKVERFVVLDGEATIRLRRMFHDDVLVFEVSGETPVAIDMPTMWAHDITNTGSSTLTTLFWTDTLFDPEEPDTVHEPVDGPMAAS